LGDSMVANPFLQGRVAAASAPAVPSGRELD
jgi:hypothetical protein